MTDVSKTIAPKSDQLNADDLIGIESMTIKVTKVSLLAGEQPIAINYENDNGHPFKPCKSMRRVLVQLWGGNGEDYIGRSMSLFRDVKVKFGGAEVGGIRISHVSHIDEPVTLALTTSKAQRRPFIVKPLKVIQQAPEQPKSAPPTVQAVEVSEGHQEAPKTGLIEPDQVIYIGDLLAKRADLKMELVRKYNTLSNIPAAHYAKIVAVIQEKIGETA